MKAVPLGSTQRVGRRHVGVGPEDRRHAPVQVPAERLLLRGGLGVDLDHDRVRLALQALDHPVRAQEGVLGLHVHVLAAEDREDGHLEPPGRDDHVVPSRAGGGQVRGPADPVDLRDLGLPAALVPDVVAQRDRVDARLEERAGDQRR
jgi:hypothetical protein